MTIYAQAKAVKEAAELEQHFVLQSHVGRNGITHGQHIRLKTILRSHTEYQLEILRNALQEEMS